MGALEAGAVRIGWLAGSVARAAGAARVSKTRIAWESSSTVRAVSACSRRRTANWTMKTAQTPMMTRKIRLVGGTARRYAAEAPTERTCLGVSLK